MFEKILVPVDGSSHSDHAATIAGDLGDRYVSEIVVLHVREHELAWGADVDLEPKETAEALVGRYVDRLRKTGANARGETRLVAVGRVPQEILEVAEAEGVGLIVIGTRGLTEWQRLVMGSVASKVVHHAGCPVLVTR